MAQNYTSIPERSLAGGINQQASEDSIPDGYVENAVNVTINTEGLMKKRPGFRTYLGHMPIRAAKISWDHTKATDNLTFELTSNEHSNVDVDLSNVASTALLVVGRSSTPVGAGPEFNSTYSYRYYTGFTANPRKVLGAGTYSYLSYPQAEHGYLTKDLFVGIASSDSQTNKNNKVLFPEEVNINETTFDINLRYNNTSGTLPVAVFTYALPLVGIAGSSYAGNHSTALIGGKHTITIPYATHNLNSFNIIVRSYERITAGTMTEIVPNEVFVNEQTGEVKLEFSSALTNIRVLLHIPNVGNQFLDSISKNTVRTIEIPDLAGDFIFLDCFVRDPVNDQLRQRVLPTAIEVDTFNRKATVTFDNSLSSIADKLTLIWDFATIKTTKFTVTAQTTLSSSGTDLEPELSIYGLLAEDIYPNTDPNEQYNGWVQHLDTYKTEQNTTVVAGMGWNLFRGLPRSIAPSYLATLALYPSLRARASNDAILAPAFHDAEQPVVRTRGGLQFTGGGEGWGQIQSITWNAALGGYDVVLATPNLAVTGTPIESFSASQPYGDMLTIRGAELNSFNGSWAILSSIYVTSLPFQHVTFTIKTDFESSDYDCGQVGEAGVFTDRLSLETTAPLLLTKGDLITAQSFPTGTQLGFLGYYEQSDIRYTFVEDVVEELVVAAGQLLICQRDSKYCFGLRNLGSTATGFSQTNGLVLVRGDSLTVTGRDVPIEVSHLLTETQSNLNLVVEDEVGTLSNIGNASRFAVGQRVLISQLGIYSGEYQVTAVAFDNTSLTLDCTGVPDISLASVTIPPYFELKESLSLADDLFNRNYFEIEGRWECIEKPQIDSANLSRYSLIEPTVTEHFDSLPYGGQLPIRSTMSQNNLYLTNGTDPVQKYDGVATYRAGLPRWQPQLFISQGNTPESELTAGVYSYYFRLGAIDENNTRILSAMSGVADYLITVAANHSVHLRLLGFPNWDDYDFEKLSLEIYRTKVDVPGEFFLVTRLEMPQIPSGGYIDYIDLIPDYLLQKQGQDEEVAITYGLADSATSLNEPLRAKYMTSIDNRLVLGNLRDWQRVDLNFSRTTDSLTADDFIGTTLMLRDFATDTGTVTDMVNRAGFYFCTDDDHISITSADITFNSITKIVTVPLGENSQTPQPGDWIYLTINGNANQHHHLSAVGWWQIRAVSVIAGATSVDIYIPNYVDAATRQVNYAFLAPDGTKHIPVYIGLKDSGPPENPVKQGDNAWGMTGGHADNIIQITLRLAAAVNACMRQVDVALPAYAGFKPWIMAESGGDFNLGDITFIRPKESGFYFAVTLPTFNPATQLTQVTHQGVYKTGTIVAEDRAFPSRIIFSYRNFPELFNNSSKRVIDELAAATELWPIDINPADGQEITGIIPFFGESVISGSQREEQLVVFKTNSIYVVDLDTRKVQKIESNGLGCTAPYSIASTKDGIMFANESGIYKLTRAQTVEPVGQYIDRVWRNEVDRDNLALAHGHHYGIARQYKLSAPTENLYNEDVFVYEHTRESRGQIGSWTRFTNHQATGWCNLFNQEFFATTKGRVCVLKDSGSSLDFSDRGEVISSEITLRSTDFGISNVRKKLLHVSLHLRNPQKNDLNLSQESTSVYVAADLVEDFRECDKYEGGGLFVKTGLADAGLLKGETVRFNVPVTKAIRYQPKIINSGLYETIELSGITYRVSGLTTKGTKEAKDTEK